MTENPYESSAQGPPLRRPTSITFERRDPFPYYVPITQFAIRILGVYAFAGGASYVVQNLVDLGLARYTFGYENTLYGSLAGNVVYALFGLYCLISGRWIIETVFLPPGAAAELASAELADDESLRNE
jgi:hypothetical protein